MDTVLKLTRGQELRQLFSRTGYLHERHVIPGCTVYGYRLKTAQGQVSSMFPESNHIRFYWRLRDTGPTSALLVGDEAVSQLFMEDFDILWGVGKQIQ